MVSDTNTPTSDVGDEAPQLQDEGALSPASEPTPPDQQQPAPEKDPFEGLTAEEARKRFPEAFATERETGRRDGHGEARKEVAVLRKGWEQEDADRRTFEMYEDMRLSTEPEKRDRYLQELAPGSDLKASYERGVALKAGPSRKDLEAKIGAGFFSSIDDYIMKEPEMQNLSEEERERINPAKFGTYPLLLTAEVELLVEKRVTAGKVKADDKTVKEARDATARRVKDELGVGSEGLEGSTVSPGSQAEAQERYINGDITTDEYDALCQRHGWTP